jgi:hypothetical protein
MVIKLIVVQQITESDTLYWTAGAWDEYTLDENPEGFSEDVAKHVARHGEGSVRIVDVRIPEGTFAKAFAPLTVTGTVEK